MADQHMQPPADRPPSYTQHDAPADLQLPPVTNADPPPPNERTLPPLSQTVQNSSPWPSTNPLSAYYQGDSPSPMDVESVASPDSRGQRAGSVLSIDDPDVRMAAEALGDLRAGSPPRRSSRLPSSRRRRDAEPLLSLLTTSHPIIGTAIGGSLSAYSASKNYSPRFKSSAEYVERRFTPVVNTLGTVGRVTGVEGGVRWFLGGGKHRHRSQNQSSSSRDTSREGSNKRRKLVEDAMDVDSELPRSPHVQDLVHRERRSSQSSSVAESLPAYDDHRSPKYEESAAGRSLVRAHDESDATWQSRLMLSTSGLSIAMSEESLRSLKYCLSWLRWANEHIGKVIVALKTVLEEYERAISGPAITSGEQAAGQLITRSEADRSMLVAQIAEMKKDVMKTVKGVVDVVSKYAGGALPENARALVRHHLTSLPQRFRMANRPRTSSDGKDGETKQETDLRDSAQRVMVLAKECLDMMSQVSGVLDGTIVSAEEWCERLGRKKAGQEEPHLEVVDDGATQREKQAVGEALASMNQAETRDA